MELEQLKNMWKDQESNPTSIDIKPLLGKKSNSPVAKIKRHLYMELWAVIVLYGSVIAYYAFMWQGRFISVSILFLIMGALYCIYFFKKRKLLNEMECMTCQVKSNLSKQVNTLEKYIKFYLWAGTFLLPVTLAFFYWFEHNYIPSGNEKFFPQPSENRSVIESLAIFFVITTVVTVVFYFINKWYVRKLYGRYVDSLKRMLSQMDEDAVFS